MTPNLERLEDLLVHLFAALTDVNIIRFSHEHIVISGVVGVQIAPTDGKWAVSASGDGFKPLVFEHELDAALEAFNVYCLLLREVLLEDYLGGLEEPPEPQPEKAT